MSSNRSKYEKARRRLAAVTFLTNISLDGTFKDTELAQIAVKSLKCDRTDAAREIPTDKEVSSRNSVRTRTVAPQVSPVHRSGADNQSLSSDSELTTNITPIKSSVNQSFRER